MSLHDEYTPLDCLREFVSTAMDLAQTGGEAPDEHFFRRACVAKLRKLAGLYDGTERGVFGFRLTLPVLGCHVSPEGQPSLTVKTHAKKITAPLSGHELHEKLLADLTSRACLQGIAQAKVDAVEDDPVWQSERGTDGHRRECDRLPEDER